MNEARLGLGDEAKCLNETYRSGLGMRAVPEAGDE